MMTIAGTHSYWQDFEPQPSIGPPYAKEFSVEIEPGVFLKLPLRVLPLGDAALASLIANHASFQVIDRLTNHMAELARPLNPELIVGLPTLGLSFAPGVAARLGHKHFVPLGTSRKFWYEEALSVPIHSVTSPSPGKRLYLDPNLLVRLEEKRIVLIDDVISTGRSAECALELLGKTKAIVAGCVVAMDQAGQWAARLPHLTVCAVFKTPRFRNSKDGWWPEPE